MSTPVEEIKEPRTAPAITTERSSRSPKRNGDDDHTVVGDGSEHHNSPNMANRPRVNTHETLQIPSDMANQDELYQLRSPSANREAAFRLEDDLMLLKAERMVSKEEENRSRSRNRSQSRRREEPVDDFDVDTNPIHEKISVYKPPKDPNTSVGKFFKKIHNSIWLVRYFVYIIPLTALLLIPLLLGRLRFPEATVGGVTLFWFSIWLEIVWLSLWAGRIIAKCLPWPIGLITSMFSNNSKKWRDMMKQLELAATLFFWALAIEISFLPTMTTHHADGNRNTKHWESVANKVWISFLVGMTLNFAEKIIIQLIAISFHLRTYADRIDINKFQIASLIKLYEFSKQKIGLEDQEFEEKSGPASGAMTPRRVLHGAQQNTTKALNKVGDVAGKIAGDFTGKKVALSSHPQQVVLALLATGEGSQVIARRLYRTFCREETETVYSDDLRPAFENDDEANAAFTMFDKDMNGDISMEELEAVCVEIGRERKSITASLKDLDSVVSKLDDVLIFVVCVITLLVFISLISTSAAGVLTSAGSAVLALSWLFSATAQEFLQSIIFVFVKHPFDVGDRVSIYGNTGSTLKGDDYFVKEISLLYTEFKKMEGHIVQAPNSYLNTIFILNQRRSGGLAEAVPVTVKFGTTLDQIDGLRTRLLEFVSSEKREYQANILTELRDITEAHAITLNVVFFYKSNWQNELLRLQRRNKFICAMMISMQELGIEGPRMRYPGQKESFPVYLQNVPFQGAGSGSSDQPRPEPQDAPFVESTTSSDGKAGASAIRTLSKHPSILNAGRNSRPRGESLAQMGRRVDFSLGMRDVTNSNLTGNVFDDDRERDRQLAASLPTPAQQQRAMASNSRTSGSMERFRRRASSIVAPQSDAFVSGSEINRSGSMMSSHAAALGSRLQRVGTDSSLARQRSNHRNRFWSMRSGQHHQQGESTDELWNDHDGMTGAAMAEQGMAGIPEMSRANSRLDPRSGRVSPTAWRASTDEPRRDS